MVGRLSLYIGDSQRETSAMLQSGAISLVMLLAFLWLTGGWLEDRFASGIVFIVLWAACWLFVYTSFFRGKDAAA